MNNIKKLLLLSIFLILSCKKDKITEKDPLEYTKKLNGSFYFTGVIINEASTPFEIIEYKQNCNFIYVNNKTIVSPVLSLIYSDTFNYAYSNKNEKKIVYTFFYDDHDFLVQDTIIYYYEQKIIHYNGYLENSYGLIKRFKLKTTM